MGFYYTLYTGPYIECKTHMIEGSTIMYGCQKVGCKVFDSLSSYKRSDFCSSCGSEIKEVKSPTEVKAVDERDFEFNGEELICISGEWIPIDPLTDIWQPNIKFLDRETHHDDNPSIQEVNPVVMQREIEKLSITFKDQISSLIDKYDSVTLKWGVIGYSS